jgi:peptidoglycan/xylan/chitin deacetylase (PgdA/CDA1 family)
MRGLILAAALLASAWPGAAKPVRVALTFDDLPAHSTLPPGETRMEVARRIIAALKAAGAPEVYGFVNGALAEHEPESAPALDLWRAAGFPLGNHTFSHPNLDQVGPETFQADILKNEPLLQQKMPGADWRWLRYPYLAEGASPEARQPVRRFLAERGYRVASVTLSFDDWAFNEPYARCRAKGDEATVALLEATYMEWARESLAYERALSRATEGRDIPYVLLMHEGAFDARMLPRLLQMYREEGVEFISLAEAEKDRFYAADLAAAPSPAATTLEAAALAKGMPVPPKTWAAGVLESICR